MHAKQERRLYLKKIDKENWSAAIQLSVHEAQRNYIATNLYSIAEVQFLDDFYVRGIYLDKDMIGFAMFGIDSDDGAYWIYRFMIDKDYQGKGYGVNGIKLVIEEIRHMKDASHTYIMIGYHPENNGARQAYRKVGFIEREVAPWGEQLAYFRL